MRFKCRALIETMVGEEEISHSEVKPTWYGRAGQGSQIVEIGTAVLKNWRIHRP